MILRFALGVVPVFVFLAALAFIDTYKLVTARAIGRSVAWGCLAACVCFGVTSGVVFMAPSSAYWYSRVGAPVLEEAVKSLWILWLIRTARVGFMVDTAICAVAVGAGFALIENAADLHLLSGTTLAIWTLRGFGTAMMHAGTTAIVGVTAANSIGSGKPGGLTACLPGLLLAIAIHCAWNMAVLTPLEASIAVLVGMPVIFTAVFISSEKSLRRWMDAKLSRDVELLNMIATGQFLDTNAGRYLQKLRKSLSPRIVGDMLCMIELSLELSVLAKGELIRREAGLPVAYDESIAARLRELSYLSKSIGFAGRRSLRPLLTLSPRDLWEMHQLSDR